MKRLLIIAAVLLLASPAQARIKLAALPEREAAVIRLDNPAATLVEEERVLTLQQGENQVDFSWRGVQIDPDSIRIALLSHPEEVTLLSVSYPPNEAALVWRIHSRGAWEEKVRISYLLSYIDRLVTYKAVADTAERFLDLESYLVLRNFSGEDFDLAEVLLGYGESMTRPVAHEETSRIRLFTSAGVPVKKTFTWDAALMPWEPKRLDENVGIPVHYVIRNDAGAGLGKTGLWGGKARVFQDDGHGTSIFLGEDNVGLVPVGEEMRIYIGDSRDVSVTQQKMVDRRVNLRPSKYTVRLYDTDEEITVKVESFKDQPVTVSLVEHLEGQWDMEEADLDYERKDASTIVFNVELPGKGAKEFSFSYHRRNVRP